MWNCPDNRLTHLLKRANKWFYVLSCGMIVILCTHGFILNMTINKFPIFGTYSWAWYIYPYKLYHNYDNRNSYHSIFSRYFKWAMGEESLIESIHHANQLSKQFTFIGNSKCCLFTSSAIYLMREKSQILILNLGYHVINLVIRCPCIYHDFEHLILKPI